MTGSTFVAGTDPHVCSLSKYASEINEFRTKLPSVANATVISLFQRLDYLFGPSFEDEWTAYTIDEIREISSALYDVREVHFAQDYEAAPSSPIIELTKPIERCARPRLNSETKRGKLLSFSK